MSTPAALPSRPRALRSWAPVAIAMLLALATGAAIIGLRDRADRTRNAEVVVARLAAEAQGPRQTFGADGQMRFVPTELAQRQPPPPPAGGPPLRDHKPPAASARTHIDRAIREARAVAAHPALVDAIGHSLGDLHGQMLRQAPTVRAGAASATDRAAARAMLTALDARLDALASDQHRAARRAVVEANTGALLLLALAGIGVAWLLRRFDRLRHAEARRHAEELRRLAEQDALTGLANRRRLAADLERATGAATLGAAARLLLFDLDGFKAYNDRFGHHEGDRLLCRLGAALRDAVGDAGAAYRLGGDEFCVLLEDRAEDMALIAACVDALTEAGDGYDIRASHGSVLVPAEATDPATALQLADQRMYGRKGARRASAGEQAAAVAAALLAAARPDLRAHGRRVAALAERVGRVAGLDRAELGELVMAAELHDVGRLGDGDAAASAQLLEGAAGLRHVAELIRAATGRYDAAQPVAARVLAATDAYITLAEGGDTAAALATLQADAGTAFDPAVVAAIAALDGDAAHMLRAAA